MEKNKTKVVNEQDLIARAKAHFKNAVDVFQETYDEMIEDLNFVNGDQWPAEIVAQREADKRPCLRINKLPQFVDRVQGDMRQARPSIKIRPVDDIADDETADIMTGLIRNIETQSDAEIVYDSGGEAMVQCGFGAWRVITEYVSDDSFDQEILIERIKNQFTVLLDPAANRWDRSDGRFAFVYEDMPRDLYSNRFKGKSELPWSGDKKSYGDWATEKTIRVAEYFEREINSKKLYMIHVKGEDKPKTVSELPEETHVILKERSVESSRVFWYRINGIEILEGPIEVKGSVIPLIPVYGKEINILGRSHYYGIVRHSKDSMRMYNYYRSMDAETIALAPRAPWLMTEKMIGPYKKMWDSANTRNFSYLLYVPDPNHPGLKPERNFPSIANQAIIQNIMVADQELHDTTGLQLASLGKRSNEQSGKAIEARAKEGDIGQYTYVDNQVRAIKHTAKVIVAMMPYIYDMPRIQRIIGEDSQAKNVKINQRFKDETDGKEKIFDLTTGKYDVVGSVGPSYETQRQESLAAMIDFAKILDPPQRSIMADQIASTSDWHGADIMAKRFRKTLPPGIAEPEEGEEPAQPTEEQLKQQAMAEAQAEAQAEMLEVELETKKAERKKADAEAAEAEANAAIAEAKALRVSKGLPAENKAA
jgi:hypothetical protein